MSHYRRYDFQGGQYFFTINLRDRTQDYLLRHIQALRAAYRETKRYYPFETIAITILPEHIHWIMQLPKNEENFSIRLQIFKYNFSKRLPEKQIWQKRFWEHFMRDEHDLHTHIQYTYFNPVKHGYVLNVHDWAYSSFHRDVKLGLFEPNWGADLPHHVLNLYDE